ncbi:MAG: alpha/beta fold hydrolase [Actinomycetota bacterium]
MQDIVAAVPSPTGEERHDIPVQLAGPLQPGAENVVLVAHDFHHGHRSAGEGGWWPAMIGPERPLDTRRYTILTPSHGFETPGHAPELRLSHIADAMAAVLDHLQIERLHAVIGGGSGGLAALTFAVRHPHRTRRLLSIASGARVTTLQSMHLAHQIAALDLAGEDPDRLELAWRIFTVRRGSLTALEAAAGSSDVEDIDRYLHRTSRRYWEHTDPHALRRLLWAWRHFDLATDSGMPDASRALSRLAGIQTLVLGIDSDALFYPAEQAYLTQLLDGVGVSYRRFTVHSEQGHDGWLSEPHIYGPLVTEALA